MAKKTATMSMIDQARSLSKVRIVRTWIDDVPEPKRTEVLETLRLFVAGQLSCTLTQLVDLFRQHGVEATRQRLQNTVTKMREQ